MTKAVEIIRPSGRLDGASAPALEATILSAIDGGVQGVLLDCADLTYVSSAGLRVILIAAKRLGAAGGVFALCGLTWQVERILDTSGFTSFLDIHPSVEAATRALDAS
jgi:anti-anti-sigma factor